MTIFPYVFLLIASLAPTQAIEIGVKVWQNECGGTVEGLTSWNDGEEFASLGIGHFIWYPEHARGPFVETFPELIQFLKSNGVEIPRWIEDARGCPWKNRSEFQSALQANTKQITDLRRLLQKNIPLQAEFLQKRLKCTLPTLFANASEEKKAKLESHYNRIVSHPDGLFAILDYVNFKGYGTSQSETYDGLGWGLFQVLDNMSNHSNEDPLKQFVASAKEILEQRVKHSPPLRREQRFLKGWFRRIDSYVIEKNCVQNRATGTR
jgi:hypothetical protein